MPKISALPPLASLADDDEQPIVDDSTATTKKFDLATIRAYFDSFIKPTDLFPYDFVFSGGVWSGDSYGVNRNASMTAAVIYIDGRRHTVALVTARTFTASKDTYIDALSNADGTATLVYTEVTNNAASPSLDVNSIRLGIIITGASTIVNVGSVNQGQEDKVLPIASSVPYAFTDSLGNIIRPTDPNCLILGMRRLAADFSTTSTSVVQVTGVSVPVIIPTTGKVSVEFETGAQYNLTVAAQARAEVWDGTVGSGTQVAHGNNGSTSGGNVVVAGIVIKRIFTPPNTGLRTYNYGLKTSGTGTATIEAATSAGSNKQPGLLIVRRIP